MSEYERAPIPIHVKRFLVRHRPARMRAQRAKGKATFFFFFSKRQNLVHSLPRQLDCRSICFHCCDGRSPLLPINLFVGFHRKGAKSLHVLHHLFSLVRSLAKSRVRRAKVTRCRKFIGPTILTMTWPTVQNTTHRARKHTHKTVV